MAVDTVFSTDEKRLTIKVRGRFDFGLHQAFRSAYEDPPVAPEQVVIDLAETTYLDSSALGMLLLLREYQGDDQARVSVVNANTDVRTILAISNFSKLFEID
ncbi:STAS domain-containing protein [Pseudomonas entomophila]|uniref:STAS domain-containing protein n=1 Tax=Pseudomonas entomophila TaxID=312306 RepID=UPI0015E323AE|nr:STAS domain-containing protein [Pseudomonas entomophila]MBA1192541.1 STAS domain-containing protein [Pseudomonas entomophila]